MNFYQHFRTFAAALLLACASSGVLAQDVKVVMEAKIVPSGVAEVARLQAKEGFAYLKP